ncbi:tryptophan 2,3-dioxygenase family protein [Fulvivirga kasyanovii]|uniref:Tryptophan 2,3-dioxygenase n=1 Tax=Fulvivirga kasyanovii TaxID=396812 RepID=A0ABW9RJS0_9BACT|nr:tryptophan 2,3-dioxygenase family protein [Fulvivirga kasyanovii]MTI24175.1 tryptophan 2,3-dioxygenase [Fulvivirga kasyanovii]
MDQKLLQQLEEKYRQLGENPEAYLKGLLEAKPITYWDYVELETLLSLQRPRTEYKDETIFIMYHQITELTLKLILHELEQITGDTAFDPTKIIQKIRRIIRYTDMLITSYDVMREGMDCDDYNAFRMALTPASGFQSVQFRYIELHCTPLLNLVNENDKSELPQNPTAEDYFRNIYWRNAGYDRKTGNTKLTLRLFEEKYLNKLISLAKGLEGNTLQDKLIKIKGSLPENLRLALRDFDRLYNIKWPLVHLRTAGHYLDSKGTTKAATGGSKWKRYLHPQYQQRRFFPNLWSAEEKANWGTYI